MSQSRDPTADGGETKDDGSAGQLEQVDGRAFAVECWNAQAQAACQSLYTPFMRHLVQGTLPLHVYRRYKRQDAFYLLQFERLHTAAAELCAASASPQVVRCAEHFRRNAQGTREERMAVYGLEDETVLRTDVNEACDMYLEFLHAHSSDPAELAVSLLPCGRLYAFLGQVAAAHLPHVAERVQPEVRQWVEEYGSPAFESEVQKLEVVVEVLQAHSLHSKEHLRALYGQAMHLEWLFFDVYTPELFQPNPCPSHVLFLLDFDSTLTDRDTLAELPKLCEGGRQNWSAAYARYDEANRAFMAGQLAEEGEADLHSFFLDLDHFEESMLGPVAQDRLLEGLTREDVSRAARGCPQAVRPGFVEFQRVFQRRSGHAFSVISMNWSGSFIEEFLAARSCAPMPVLCNELVFDDTGHSLARGAHLVSHGGHKKTHVLELIAKHAAVEDAVSVFVGDSLHDVPAALACDLGIILCPHGRAGVSGTLRRVCERFGVQLRPLVSIAGMAPWRGPSKHERTLYVATGWEEVHLFSACTFQATPTVPWVMSVAGSDSCAGAGSQADLKACEHAGSMCANVLTCTTAQSTLGVDDVVQLPAGAVEKQMECVLRDMQQCVVKTGMLPNEACVEAVAHFVKRHRRQSSTAGKVTHLVVDPVIISTTLVELVPPSALAAIVRHLMPLADLITPNVCEALHLVRNRSDRVRADEVALSEESMRGLCEALGKLGCRFVLLKGGHVSGGETVCDMLYNVATGHAVTFCRPRVRTANTHGTGCTLASAIAAYLAKGYAMEKSVALAGSYVHRCIRQSRCEEIGRGFIGSMSHRGSIPRLAVAKRVDLSLYVLTDPMVAAHGLTT